MGKENNSHLIINQLEVIKHPIISLKKSIHPLLLNQMPARRNFELKFLNEIPKVEGPVLYLVTHATCHDAPIACEVIKDHFYVMVGKQSLELEDRLFFNANGKIDCDRDSKNSGRLTSDKTVRILSSGSKAVIYPERTWCTKPSKPINHCAWGWVDILKRAQAKSEKEIPAIPIALEYYEYTDNCCYVNAGKPIIVEANDFRLERNDELEEVFVTLKTEIWEQFPIQKRDEVDPYLWRKIMQQRYAEYPKLDISKEKTYVIGYKNDPEYVLNSPAFRNGLKKLEEAYGEFVPKVKEKIR